MLLAAALTLVFASGRLAINQANSLSALLLADAGINSEIQFIGLNSSAPTAVGLSSQPIIYGGSTAIPPGETSPAKGRPGTVIGYSGGTYYVFASNDSAGQNAWDGATSPYYITSWAVVGDSWRRVQVRFDSADKSLFNQYGLFALACFPGNSNSSILVSPNTTVTIDGTAATNGQVDSGINTKLIITNAINADTADKHNAGTQFTTQNLAPNGTLTSQSQPILAPTTAAILIANSSLPPTTSDDSAWAYLAAHNSNSSGVYQFKTNAGGAAFSSSNCTRYTLSGTVLNQQLWQGANPQPGTAGRFRTLFFEPGDYYFTDIQLAYDSGIGMVIDPCAYASGGTPGQVRFWCYGSKKSANFAIGIPISNTMATGTTDPDPGLFRLYVSSDSGGFKLQRTQGALDWRSRPMIGDWNYYCGIYACTRDPGASNNSNKGTQIALVGTNNGQGAAVIRGSIIADQISFTGANVAFVASQTTTTDPTAPVQAGGGSWTLIH